jgi:hypothetical protein
MWCRAHARKERELRSDEYMNQWGVFALDWQWPRPLRMVAIHGWMLSHMCPCDCEAFLSCAPRLVGPGGCLNGRALLHLWVAAFLKWPKAIRIWASMVADGVPGVSVGSPESIAGGYAKMSLELARQCDSDDMAWVHKQITTGRHRALFGLPIWLSKLGMISTGERQKQGQADAGEAAMAEIEVTLGLPQKTYTVVADTVVWKELLAVVAKFDATHASGFPVPRNIQESRNFVSVLQDFLADFPACFGYGRAPSHSQTEDVTCKQHAPKSHNAGYCRKTIIRKIVVWAQSCSPQCAWQGWTAGMLAQVCPDANGYLGHLSPTHQARNCSTYSAASTHGWHHVGRAFSLVSHITPKQTPSSRQTHVCGSFRGS